MRMFLVFFTALTLMSGCSRQDPLFIDNGAPEVAPYLEVIPNEAEINVGTSQPFQAFLVDPVAQTREEVTSQASWTSSDTSIATVSTAGRASGVATGNSSLAATLDDLSANASLSVVDETLVRIQLLPAEQVALVGMQRPFQALAEYASGRTQDVTADASWASGNTAVADIASPGLTDAISQGLAPITATLSGVVGNAELGVLNATIDAMSITPEQATINVQTSEEYRATVLLSTGDTIDVTDLVTWSSSDGTVASVSNDTNSKGRAFGIKKGTASIVASATFASVTIAQTAQLTVDAVEIVSLSIEPANISVAAGTTGTLTATAYYDDDSAIDVTRDAFWLSSNPNSAFIESTGNNAGAGEAQAPGDAKIFARFGGLTASSLVTITEATLESIQVTPITASISAGTALPYSATGIYSDGSLSDLTTRVNWSSADPAIARVDASGLVYGVSLGTTSIIASYDGKQSAGEAIVTNAVVSELEISPLLHSMQVGTTQQYTATAIFSDGRRYDVSDQTFWQSSDSNIVAMGPFGRVNAVSAGNATISGKYEGITGNALARVTATTLESLAVIPRNLDLQAGTRQEYSAVALFSDHIEDVTSSASWVSSNTQIATVSNAGGSKGLVTTLSAGQVEISANFDGLSSSGVLSVFEPSLVSLDVTCVDDVLQLGNQTLCEATGTYSDGHRQIITNEVLWRSSNTTVATVENAATNRTPGRVTALAVGSSNISASIDGISDSVTISVETASLVSIDVTTFKTTLIVGETEPFFALGNYNDGSTNDLSESVVWTSSNSSVLAISNAIDRKGEADALSDGTAVITASQDGVLGNSPTITVNPEPPSNNIRKIDVLCLGGQFGGPIELEIGEQDRCQAIATNKDNTTQDVTALATWSADKPSLLRVIGLDNNNEFLLVEGLSSGNTLLRADYVKSGSIVFKIR
ncbi:hypothetical protein A3742_15330 [Oleiphilus sp. HI0071]|uniref:Ig-like domain-containing protein n=2 Tax=unclassified Oleiphilus TaxID=2631174 RepID=UPI0007C3FB1A|nr:Ig-like domain-containing protein [Oleiphilus sp. HI0079]KZY60145.1 hypothetical protein A3737_06940 [Oleiphilus sp. HI0065]KZY78025.1 hypothetical protein A3742_15330 [Oleiphilus sp. HI0071]KZY90114.1 hypothetical protein A3744_05705 [Oleiphilus sp. HI0073]KZZ50329.1 hypothetical protein A3760_02225 [Oleiphilus sp. HI0122]KZZ78872.1 hypothetical protein A3767_01445 [Oleiphilus sp. HI0133]